MKMCLIDFLMEESTMKLVLFGGKAEQVLCEQQRYSAVTSQPIALLVALALCENGFRRG